MKNKIELRKEHTYLLFVLLVLILILKKGVNLWLLK